MRSVLTVALAILALGYAIQAGATPPPDPAAESNRISGKVLETLDAAGYTYVRFETSDGEAWAAVPQASLEIGSRVVIANPQAMANFNSKTLKRTFETIYFGTLADGAAEIPLERSAANPHVPQHGGMGAASIDVTRAEGAAGKTISELYAEKDSLAGKTVTLRGKVVKYSPNIMGRNWIHLRDGTGNTKDGTDDVTVTSSATTAVGETVLVEGVVAVDKDFGAGYRYAVIVENASFK
ncbi:MAG: nucleotide-binding protein [bacterium]|nr:nucleotide-binding protein [bacterium]